MLARAMSLVHTPSANCSKVTFLRPLPFMISVMNVQSVRLGSRFPATHCDPLCVGLPDLTLGLRGVVLVSPDRLGENAEASDRHSWLRRRALHEEEEAETLEGHSLFRMNGSLSSSEAPSAL